MVLYHASYDSKSESGEQVDEWIAIKFNGKRKWLGFLLKRLISYFVFNNEITWCIDKAITALQNYFK